MLQGGGRCRDRNSTSCDLLDVVEDEVHELIVAFECSGNCG